jgi:hypothetical protein
MEKKSFSVEIIRVHKSSPYNCSAFLPDVRSTNAENVIKLKPVKDLIRFTFGKKLIVNITDNSFKVNQFLQYEITKSKAV